MKKNDAEKNLMSGMNKVRARKNPFADTDADDSASDSSRGITYAGAFVRPRYGAYIAAAVLIVCVAAGAVFIGKRAVKEDNSSPDSLITAAAEITNVDKAISAYRDADRCGQRLLFEFDSMLSSSNLDYFEAARSDAQAKLIYLENIRNATVEYLREKCTSVLILDAYMRDGDDAVHLMVFNGLPRELKLSGSVTAYIAATGEKYTDLKLDGTYGIGPGTTAVIRVIPEKELAGELKIMLGENGSDERSIDFSEIVRTLCRERIDELTRIISGKDSAESIK